MLIVNKTLQLFTFEDDNGANVMGNCTVMKNQGAIGAESVNCVRIQNGSINYGQKAGCPFQNNTCPNGFAYYGWMQFLSMPSQCDQYHVAVSTAVFNIRLLGNGHLAAYAWLFNGTEYYGESTSPMLLNIWYPIIVEFKRFPENGTYRLILIANDQLVGGCDRGRQRTYAPPVTDLVFGGNGVSNNCSGSMQFDRTTVAASTYSLATYYGYLYDIPQRQSNCASLGGVLVRPLTCYYVVTSKRLNWTQAYDECKASAYTYGYVNGRLASFPNDNATAVFAQLAPKLATYGNGSETGYSAWISGGHRFQWLTEDMTNSVGPVVIPGSVVKNESGSNASTCLYVDTRTNPWQWVEEDCSKTEKYICQMSFDCAMTNPCKNQGSCLPLNDGQNVCKCYGSTSGKYCENGVVEPTCINGCSCPFPDCIKESFHQRNCSDCVKKAECLLLLTRKFIYKLKLSLLEIGADDEKVDSWQCSLCGIYFDLIKNVTNAFNDTEVEANSRECLNVLETYAKILLHSKIFRKLIKYYRRVNKAGLRKHLVVAWSQINETFEAFQRLPCFLEFIRQHLPYVQYAIDWRHSGERDNDGFDNDKEAGKSSEDVFDNGCPDNDKDVFKSDGKSIEDDCDNDCSDNDKDVSGSNGKSSDGDNDCSDNDKDVRNSSESDER